MAQLPQTLGVAALAVAALTAACAPASQPPATPTTATSVAVATQAPAPAAPAATTATAGPQDAESPEAPGRLPTATPIAGGSAPRAAAIEGIAAWINSEPLTMEALRGKVVLIDFWTYTCINCLRTLPYLRAWWDKYADEGLVMIGVHSPEFDFEKDYDNVVAAVAEHEIGWPVAQDNDFTTWRNYRNRYWPAKYLIDKDGFIRYTHFGEGAYAETEERIQALLTEAGSRVSGETVRDPTGPSARELLQRMTIELYAGYARAASYPFEPSSEQPPVYLGNYDRTMPYGVAYPTSLGKFVTEAREYTDEIHNLRNHHFYLQGVWEINAERSRHARTTDGYEDYVAVPYTAGEVNAVIKPAGAGSGSPVRALVTVDDEPVPAADRGSDIVVGADGRTYVEVDGPRMYRLLSSQSFASRTLKIFPDDERFALFAFTFGPGGGQPAE